MARRVAFLRRSSRHFLLARLPRNFKFPFSTSFLQVLLVPGQSGGNGPSATPPGSMTRSSGLANASMLLRLMPAMAIQMKRLLAQSLPIQVAFSKLNSFFCGHHVIHLFLKSFSSITPFSQDGCKASMTTNSFFPIRWFGPHTPYISL